MRNRWWWAKRWRAVSVSSVRGHVLRCQSLYLYTDASCDTPRGLLWLMTYAPCDELLPLQLLMMYRSLSDIRVLVNCQLCANGEKDKYNYTMQKESDLTVQKDPWINSSVKTRNANYELIIITTVTVTRKSSHVSTATASFSNCEKGKSQSLKQQFFL